MKYVLVAAVFLAALLTGIMDAGAVWHVGANTKIDIDSNNPPNGAGDDHFKKTHTVLQGGIQESIHFSYKACCTRAANWCPPGQTLGVAILITVNISTPNGLASVTEPVTNCCADCCPVDVDIWESLTSIQGVQGAAWGGPATSVSISASVWCICCIGDRWDTSSTDSDTIPVGPMNPIN